MASVMVCFPRYKPKAEQRLMFARLCLIGGTLLVGFSRPRWWMFHQRRPDGGRDTPRRYEWYLRLPGFALLAVAACVIFLSVTNSMVFR